MTKIKNQKSFLGFQTCHSMRWFLRVWIFLGYLKGSSSSGLEEITCSGQKKQTLKNLFSSVNKSLIVALAFSLLLSFMQCKKKVETKSKREISRKTEYY